MKQTIEDTASALQLGQRERNKRDKLQRIRNAARDLFISKGFDDTTTREIALRAGVGMGTVFTYADNKRDLLFLIANEDLQVTTDRAEAALRPEASLMTNLMDIFRGHYEYLAQQPDLSRLILREMYFYDSGQQANRFRTTRERFMSLICRSVAYAKANRTIHTSADETAVGWILFAIYQVEVRNWLSGKSINLEGGLSRLQRLIEIALVGSSPSEVALRATQEGV